MISWNSLPLEIAYQVLRWTSFFLWSISFYPQVFLNFRRKRVVGLSFDFVILNLTMYSSCLIYNATLYFSSTVQKQFRQKYGLRRMIPVAGSCVAFYIHAVLLTGITLFQIAIYDRGVQKVSKICRLIVSGVWAYVAVCFFQALPTHSWLWLISAFDFIRVYMMLIKYIPQAYMNFRRKSTDGFSIGNILLGFCGWMAKYRAVYRSKFLGKHLRKYRISIFFEIVFMCQHFLLYPAKKALISAESFGETNSEDV